jgi:hypothetical protein
VVKWIEYRRGKDKRPLGKALITSLVLGAVLFVCVVAFVATTYAYFVVRTVYDDHQYLVAQVRRLSESNKTLSADLKWHKHGITTTDPVFPNLTYMLQAFSIYRHALNGQPCVVMVTAPRESAALASTVAQFSNSVSNCSTFGPIDTTLNPDAETATMTGMVPDMVVFHAERNDKAADALISALGNQIRVKRSYTPPPKNYYTLPVGTLPVHVVWLQFGTNSKWNSELSGPNE